MFLLVYICGKGLVILLAQLEPMLLEETVMTVHQIAILVLVLLHIVPLAQLDTF